MGIKARIIVRVLLVLLTCSCSAFAWLVWINIGYGGNGGAMLSAIRQVEWALGAALFFLAWFLLSFCIRSPKG